MSIDLNRDAPNVVSELQFKVLLESGHYVDIVARGEPELRRNFWHGDWIILVVSADRKVQRVLVPARSRDYDHQEIKFRDFKTANGLLSFMYRFGFREVCVPMARYGRTSHLLPVDDVPTG